jgi:hypothetical protein
MPKLGTETMNAGKSGFRFSAVRPDKLGATEYTLATVVLDFSGSVYNFKSNLEQMLDNIFEACRHSPRANNLLLRVILFSTSFSGDILEVHGFKPLADIDLNDYQLPQPGGGTPLFDAAYDAVVATNSYGKTLADQDFLVNAIEVVVTDGGDTGSAIPPSKIASEVQSAVNDEYLESNLTILVALNAAYCKQYLDDFHRDANFDHMIDVADADPKSLAKLASFISQSISSQSQSLGTGGPSQNISATI